MVAIQQDKYIFLKCDKEPPLTHYYTTVSRVIEKSEGEDEK